MKKTKRFTKDDVVPDDPLRVLTSRWETPWEIAARTGLDITRVGESLKRWHNVGRCAHAEIRCAGCVVPVFRFKTLFDK